VILDWPQTPSVGSDVGFNYLKDEPCPLGDRSTWSRPTVLLGSAGLRLSCKWAVTGSMGCTCLDPVAYDLNSHAIFDRPFPIDRYNTTAIATPPDFAHEIDTQTIDVIPLVDNIKSNWDAGFCTYSTYFSQYPDIEVMCGGVNHKTIHAGAIWRQGNFLHFGFQQSPAEMNDIGDHMLLNSIAYISNFSQDRPIAITPSPFTAIVCRPRRTVAKWLADPERADWVKDSVSAQTWQQISSLSNADRTRWAQENTPYFRSDAEGKFEIDSDLLTIQMAFDDAKFLPAMVSELASDDADRKALATRLLARYVPEAPQNATSSQLQSWCDENDPYLFATDLGDFRWYIDPLAKARKIPSSELRGPTRRDN
jgi:hypothetical protein